MNIGKSFNYSTLKLCHFLIVGILVLGIASCGPKNKVTYYSFGEKLVKEKYTINVWTRKIEGILYTYSHEGNLSSTTEYKNGKAHGFSTFYYEDALQIFETSLYKNDKLNGETKAFYHNGNPKSTVRYDNNQIIEVYNLFSEDGTELFPGNHTNGNGTILKYDKDGNLIATISIKNGVRDGVSRSISNTNYVDSVYYKNGYSEKYGHYDYLY